MSDLNLALTRLPMFFRNQVGVPGADTPLGIRQGIGMVYYVGDPDQFSTAKDVNDGTDPSNPLATIQAALDKCADGDGDVVVLLPGHYDVTAALTMTKDGVRLVAWDYLRGFAAPSVAIDGNGLCNILDISADEIEVAGIRFANSDTDDYACIRVAATLDTIGCYIHDCVFAVGLYGVYLGVTTEWAQDVLIERCMFMNMNNTAADASIYINKTTRTMIQGNWFTSNVALATYGIAIADASQPMTIVRDNDFLFQQAGTGIFRAGTTVDVSMHGNRFSGAGTPITVLVDGGDHAVGNTYAEAAGGAQVDATT